MILLCINPGMWWDDILFGLAGWLGLEWDCAHHTIIEDNIVESYRRPSTRRKHPREQCRRRRRVNRARLHEYATVRRRHCCAVVRMIRRRRQQHICNDKLLYKIITQNRVANAHSTIRNAHKHTDTHTQRTTHGLEWYCSIIHQQSSSPPTSSGATHIVQNHAYLLNCHLSCPDGGGFLTRNTHTHTYTKVHSRTTTYYKRTYRYTVSASSSIYKYQPRLSKGLEKWIGLRRRRHRSALLFGVHGKQCRVYPCLDACCDAADSGGAYNTRTHTLGIAQKPSNRKNARWSLMKSISKDHPRWICHEVKKSVQQ